MSNRAVLFDRRTQPSGFRNGAIPTPPPPVQPPGVGQGVGGGRGQGAAHGQGVGQGKGKGQGAGGGSLAALETIAALFAIGSSSVSTGRVDAPTTQGPILLKTVAGDGTSPNLDFTSIPAGYNSLSLLVIGRSSVAAASDALTLIVNNDTTAAHYDWAYLKGNNTTASSQNSGTGAASISLDFATGDTAPASYATVAIVDVPFYTATTFNKVLRASSHTLTAQSAAGVEVLEVSGFWRNTAAVTRLTLILGTGNWKAGSTGLLYGYP